MLSYRHAFHAGGHADVLKHCVLVQLTRYLGQKEAPFWYIDTHAGAGCYALDSAYAAKLSEYKNGVGRLWGRNDLPEALAEYLALVRKINPDNKLRAYPGSPYFARWSMRAQDRLRLFELHSRDARLLRENFHDAGKQVSIEASDGFVGLNALLPPPPRRGLVLIDPSYEDKQDYEQVFHSLKAALNRFPGGTYALWYPQLTRLDACQLPQRLQRLPCKHWLHVALRVNTPSKEGVGMHGSGMFVINPPWTLHATLQSVMPYLLEALRVDDGAEFVLEEREI
ncbi:MAG: 23S rRNA (adenine(2030)-N(6))-methyltransferase RlmJ [Pseudomonadota bacterium]